MKLIVDIDENFYELVKRKVADGMHQWDRCWEIIAKGVPERKVTHTRHRSYTEHRCSVCGTTWSGGIGCCPNCGTDE